MSEMSMGLPPELMAMLQGSSGEAGPGGLNGAPAEDPEAGLTAQDHLREAIKHAKLALVDEDDDDDLDNAAVSKVIQDLSALLGGRDDAAMKAMGGDPKQMRAQARAQQ